jgi:hypothetical protein
MTNESDKMPWIFYYDPDKTDPFDAAIRDQFATVVDKIINHKPWKELRNNPALHQYLADNGLYALIPTEHKTNQNDYEIDFN